MDEPVVGAWTLEVAPERCPGHLRLAPTGGQEPVVSAYLHLLEGDFRHGKPLGPLQDVEDVEEDRGRGPHPR